MLFYQMLYQRQAQSGSAFSVALYLEKRLKYFPEVYSGNSIAVVFYGNDDPVSFRSGLKAKPYPILRMFHGIVQQIAYDLGQSLFVRIEHWSSGTETQDRIPFCCIFWANCNIHLSSRSFKFTSDRLSANPALSIF